MSEWNTPAVWGTLNALIAFNTAIIGTRLLIRATRESQDTAARMIYGGMFWSVAIGCAILALYRWRHADAWPEAGLVGLAMIAVTSSIAVVYLVVWKRPQRRQTLFGEGGQ